MGILSWLRGRRQPVHIPDELWRRTLATLPFLDPLSGDEKNRLRALSAQFLAEKEFSAAGGLVLDDPMRLSIAVQGCLPVLELGLAAYRDWVGIIVYPDEFVVQRRFEDEDGIVHEFDDVLSGESWPGGPLVVSWRDVAMAGDGYNVVIHEFAHKLDMLNGEADGIPALHSGIGREEWEETLFSAYDDFCARVDAGEDTAIDPYGAEHPSEFFAVVSEAFFEAPEWVAGDYPRLYALLRRYYRQDPVSRAARR